MCSEEGADSHRFMDILDAAIKAKEVRRASSAVLCCRGCPDSGGPLRVAAGGLRLKVRCAALAAGIAAPPCPGATRHAQSLV